MNEAIGGTPWRRRRTAAHSLFAKTGATIFEQFKVGDGVRIERIKSFMEFRSRRLANWTEAVYSRTICR